MGYRICILKACRIITFLGMLVIGFLVAGMLFGSSALDWARLARGTLLLIQSAGMMIVYRVAIEYIERQGLPNQSWVTSNAVGGRRAIPTAHPSEIIGRSI